MIESFRVIENKIMIELLGDGGHTLMQRLA